MSNEQRAKLKDMLIIIATSITILLNMGVVFGGMNWVTEVNSQLAIISKNQTWVLSQIADITRWQHEHELIQAQNLQTLTSMSDKLKDVEKK